MYTELFFKAAVDGVYQEYRSLMPNWYPDKYGQTEEVDRAWKLYSNAANTQLSMLLLGDAGIRAAKEMLTNFGTTAAYPMNNPSGQVANAIKVWKGGQQGHPSGKIKVGASNRTGSILNESDWWPLPNDAWVLGGVHSLTPFYMAMAAQPTDKEVWETKFGGRPRVLGRELLGLMTFGYKRIKHASEASLGLVVAPTDKDKATGATFRQYLDAAKTYKDAASIKAVFKDDQATAYKDHTKLTV